MKPGEPIPQGVLRSLVDKGLSTQEIMQELEVSKGKALHWMKKYGIHPPGLQYAIDPPKYIDKECRYHGKTRFVLQRIHNKRWYKCGQCASLASKNRARYNKMVLVEENGGSCSRCGYDKCLDALGFHHLDRKTKSFGIAANLNRSLTNLRPEIVKCILVCANCHFELESKFRAQSAINPISLYGVKSMA